MFSVKVHQVVDQGGCTAYTQSSTADLAIGVCTGVAGASNTLIEQGPVDSELQGTDITPSAGFDFSYAALAPEGDQLWVIRGEAAAGVATISVYDRAPPNSWTFAYVAYTLPATDTGASLSPPMRVGPDRHMLYTVGADIHELQELSLGVWSELRIYGRNSLGVMLFGSATLSPDGLRMVFTGTSSGPGPGSPGVFYSDRASVTDAFTTSTFLEGPPVDGQTPFLTEDCGRVYFSGLGSVFFVAQP
jgi:hypothetical protein